MEITIQFTTPRHHAKTSTTKTSLWLPASRANPQHSSTPALAIRTSQLLAHTEIDFLKGQSMMDMMDRQHLRTGRIYSQTIKEMETLVMEALAMEAIMTVMTAMMAMMAMTVMETVQVTIISI